MARKATSKASPKAIPRKRSASDQSVIDTAVKSLIFLRTAKTWELLLPICEGLGIIQSEVFIELGITEPGGKYNLVFGRALQDARVDVLKTDRHACLKCWHYLEQIESWRNAAVVSDKNSVLRLNNPQDVWNAFRRSAAGMAADIEPPARPQRESWKHKYDDLSLALDDVSQENVDLRDELDRLQVVSAQFDETLGRNEKLEDELVEMRTADGQSERPESGMLFLFDRDAVAAELTETKSELRRAKDIESATRQGLNEIYDMVEGSGENYKTAYLEIAAKLKAAQDRILKLEAERDQWRTEMHDHVENRYRTQLADIARERDELISERNSLLIRVHALEKQIDANGHRPSLKVVG